MHEIMLALILNADRKITRQLSIQDSWKNSFPDENIFRKFHTADRKFKSDIHQVRLHF